MRIAIIGSGFGVSGHLPAFSALPGVEVAVVADSGSGRIRDRLPTGVAYAASWQEALSIPVDAVSIVVPPARQREIVSAALGLKKHVFCDKPFGLNASEADAMHEEAASAPDCTTAINYQFRFEPGIQELKRQIESGIVGTISAIDFSWITAGRASPQAPWSWRNDHAAGGGVIAAFFSHAADLIWWLTQREPRSVFGQSGIAVKSRLDEAGQRRTVTAEDMVTAQLQLEDGTIASFRISNCQEGGNGMRLEVRGSDGVLIYRHAPPFNPNGQSVSFSAKGEKRDIPVFRPQLPLDSAETRLWAVYQSVCQFVRKAQGDTGACPPSFSDGLRAHKIMDGLRMSVAQGQNIFL